MCSVLQLDTRQVSTLISFKCLLSVINYWIHFWKWAVTVVLIQYKSCLLTKRKRHKGVNTNLDHFNEHPVYAFGKKIVKLMNFGRKHFTIILITYGKYDQLCN